MSIRMWMDLLVDWSLSCVHCHWCWISDGSYLVTSDMVAIALVTILVSVLYLKCSTCCLERQVESPLSLGTIQYYSPLPVIGCRGWAPFLPIPFRQVGLVVIVDRLYPQLSTCMYNLESVSLAGDRQSGWQWDGRHREHCKQAIMMQPFPGWQPVKYLLHFCNRGFCEFIWLLYVSRYWAT